MQSYSESMAANGTVQKAGSTQPMPSGGDGRNPDQGTGAIQNVGVGPAGPGVVVKTGATNNGTTNPGSYRGSNR